MSHKPFNQPTPPHTRPWGDRGVQDIWGRLAGLFRRTEVVPLLDFFSQHEAIHGKPVIKLVWPPAPKTLPPKDAK